jgi:hypothetical protein
MPPALRQRPTSPARAAADPASPSDSLSAYRRFGALTPEPLAGTRPVWAVAR